MSRSKLVLALLLAWVLGMLGGARTSDAAALPGAWTTEIGGFGHLEHALVFADDDVWAVGDGIVHYDGVEWRQTAGFTYPSFHAIDGFRDAAMWAVGEVETTDCETYGFIVRGDGTRWRAEAVETHQPLYDVDMLSPVDGWAVGGIEVPVILHYDGVRWSAVGAPETSGLRSLHMVNARLGWAVGDDGAIVRYDGRFWIEEPSPTRATLLDVRLHDATSGWAVGISDDYSDSGTILRFENGEWDVDVNRRVPVLMAVYPLARDEALAVGASGVLVRFDGDEWREIGRTYPGGYGTDAVAPGGDGLHGIEGIDAGEGADAVGDAPIDAGPAGLVPVSPLADGTVRRRREATPDSGAQAFGRAAFAVPAAAPSGGGGPYYGSALRDVVLLPQSETLLAVGDAGQIVHLLPDDWAEVHSGRTFAAIDMLSDVEGWVVGPDGPPLHWDGTSWSATPVPRRASWLNDVVALAPDNAWAVGETGAIVHWDGSAWTLSPRVTREDLYVVDFSAADDGWTFASVTNDVDSSVESFIYHYDGQAWREVLRLCHTSISDVAALSPTDVWFALGQQEVLHFDGSTWTWIPVLGAVKDDDPAPWIHRLAAAPGGLWGIGYDGAAWSDGRRWRTLPRVDDAGRGYEYAAAAAADDGYWTVEELWSEGRSIYTLRTYDRRNVGTTAHTQRLALWDLDLVPLPDGNLEVWAAGSSATVLRYRTSAPDAVLPEPTSTALIASPEPYPTPTPRSPLEREEIHEGLVERFDADGSGEAVVGVPELVTWGEVLRRSASYERGGYVLYGSSGGYYETCYGWRPVWLAVVAGRPRCWDWDDPEDEEVMRPNIVLVALDAVAGQEQARWCYLRRVAPAYLPLALGGLSPEDLPTPYPTPEPRNITPRPVQTVDGPCPTLTPFVWAYP